MLIVQETEVGVQKLFKQFGLFSVIVFLLPLALWGQSFADFKRTQVGSFEKFQDQKDQEFNKYLKEQWKEYEAYTTPNFFEKHKPKNIESIQETPSKTIGPRININPITIETPQKNEPQQQLKKDIAFNFFGTSVGFNVDAKIKEVRFYPKNQNGIITFFGVMASSDFEHLVHDIKTIQTKLELNDWGVYQLVKTLAKNIYVKPDEEQLFRWFILSKLGYDVKIGLVRNHVVLLDNSAQTIYATPRYKIDEKYYYAVDYQSSATTLGRLYTYEKTYPEATKKLDFHLTQIPKLPQELHLKKLKFSTLDGNYEIDLQINKNLIDFMKTYPQVDYDVYFNAAFDTYVYDQLAKNLRTYINGKKASYGLNFLLHFVQKSFAYERDNEQFGKDKVMFAEETLFYDHSDCEDRAILFAKLVRKMFNYGVVGVKYKDHMSTALYIPLKGDSIKLGSRKYVIADPTYINANIGMNMPKYKSIQPETFVKLQ
jgi:hypothetical protein